MKDLLRLTLAIAEISEEYMLITDKSFNVVWANKSAKQSYPGKISSNTLNLLKKEKYFSKQAIKEASRKNIAKRRVGVFEVICVKISGSACLLCAKRSDGNGRKSEFKESIEKVRESENRLKTLLDQSPLSIQVFDKEGRCVHANKSWQKMWQSNLKDVLNYNLLKDPQLKKKGMMPLIKKAFGGKKIIIPPTLYDPQKINKKGRPRWTKRIIYPVKDNEGKVNHVVLIHEDITEQKNSEEKLRKAEALYRNTLDNMLEGCQIIGFDWRYLYVNDVLVKQAKSTRKKLLGHTMMERYPGIEKTEAFKKFKVCMKKRIPQLIENEFKFSDGTVGWFELKINSVPEGILILSEDVTEEKKAQESLNISEEGHRSLFNNMLNGFAYCKMLFNQGKPFDFVYLEVNKVFGTLTGLKNVVGKKASEAIPGIQKSDPELFERYGRVALTGKPERFETYVESMKMWFSISVYSPKKEYFVALFDEITDQKNALKHVEDIRFALDQSSIVAITDKNGVITSVNEKFCEISKYTQEELIGKTHRVINSGYHPKSFFEGLWQTIKKGKVWINEIKNRAKDGSYYWAHTTIVPILDKGEIKQFIAIKSDVTEKKKAEEEKEKLNEELKERVTELERFQNITVNRELKMIELKKKIDELEKKED